jgi:PAS domain S-box-containing protein
MSYDQPSIRLGLNFIFSTLVSLFIAYLVGRTFLVRGTLGLLLFGCGVLVWGLGGFASSFVSNVDLGLGVAVHNICVALSALCHLTGVGFLLRPGRVVRAATLSLAAAYTIAVSVVLFVVSATLAGWVPAFFIQGRGGTPLRYFVLGSATIMFLMTAAILSFATQKHLSAFPHWYSLGLVLTGVGLFGVMMQTSVGSPMNWAGRTAQYLGGIYMLIAAVASARQTRQWGIPLEAALSEVKQQYEELFAMAADGILVHEAYSETALGNFTEANPAISALLGYTLKEMHTLNPRDITVRDERPAVPVPPLFDNGVVRYERTLLGKDGRRVPVEIDTKFYQHQGRPMVMSVIRDITARRRAEEEHIRLYREAQGELDRCKELELQLRCANNDLQEFTSAIAHDLQSPLCGVVSTAELMNEECRGRLGPDADLYISQITNGLTRMRCMILDLLEYSRLSHDDKKDHALIDFDQVLEHVALNLATRIQENGAVITHDVLPVVEGNFARLVQLFQNLIENAIKYRREESPRIHISSDQKGIDCTFCVSDNGIGIDPRYAGEIFGVFKRLNSQHEGTGIGLSLCKKIVERQGGRIWVESKPGDGARFHFTIPVRAMRDHAEDPNSSGGYSAKATAQS